MSFLFYCRRSRDRKTTNIIINNRLNRTSLNCHLFNDATDDYDDDDDDHYPFRSRGTCLNKRKNSQRNKYHCYDKRSMLDYYAIKKSLHQCLSCQKCESKKIPFSICFFLMRVKFLRRNVCRFERLNV